MAEQDPEKGNESDSTAIATDNEPLQCVSDDDSLAGDDGDDNEPLHIWTDFEHLGRVLKEKTYAPKRVKRVRWDTGEAEMQEELDKHSSPAAIASHRDPDTDLEWFDAPRMPLVAEQYKHRNKCHKDMLFNAMVAKKVTKDQLRKSQKARDSMDTEWNKLVKKGVFDFGSVMDLHKAKAKAREHERKTGEKTFFARVFGFCSIKVLNSQRSPSSASIRDVTCTKGIRSLIRITR